jgi:hypothetical protein
MDTGWLALTRKVVEQGQGLQSLMARWLEIRERMLASQGGGAVSTAPSR